MAVLSRSGAGASERRREGEQAFLTATEALLNEGRSYAELSVEQIASMAGRPLRDGRQRRAGQAGGGHRARHAEGGGLAHDDAGAPLTMRTLA